jgi:hypothetical protein
MKITCPPVRLLENEIVLNMKHFLFLLFLASAGNNLYSNNPDSLFISRIDSIAKQLYAKQPDSVKVEANKIIRNEFAKLLKTPRSLSFPYDSLKFIKTVTPADLAFRLITWTVPFEEGKHGYYGFLQTITKEVVERVVELKDNGGSRTTDQSYGSDEWPGAVYYKIIEQKNKRERIFTLFGWIAGDAEKAIRTIEVLSMEENGDLRFGLPVFALGDNILQRRVVFEFTNQVPFHLAYEQQLLPGKKRKKSWMIVFNRLEGNNPSMGKFFRAAVPSYNTFDALIFDNGKWNLEENVDVRATVVQPPTRKSAR